MRYYFEGLKIDQLKTGLKSMAQYFFFYALTKWTCPPWREHNSHLKGMGDETLIGLLHIMPKNTPITH